MRFNLPARIMIRLLAFILVFCTNVPAQTTAARLHGQVTDPNRALIAAAAITATSGDGHIYRTKTDNKGEYDFAALPPGKYTINVSTTGFEPYSRDIDLAAGQNIKIDFSMTIAKQQEKIDVNEQQSGKVDTDPTSNGGAIILKEKDLEMLADDPDELTNQLRAMAGAIPGGGQAQIYVDGFAGRLPPKSAIREVRINQDPYSAEYDAPGFGRIDVFTKPGSQKFMALISYRYNDAKFNSTSPFLTQPPAYHTQMLSADFGGPLTSKSSFQFGIDHNSINDSSVISAHVLDSNLNPVQFSQAIANPKIATLASARVDYQINPDNLFFVRYQYYGKDETNDGVGQLSLASQGFNLNGQEHTLQISDTQFLSARVINESRFQFMRVRTDQRALQITPEILVPGAFVGGGNNISNSLVSQNNYEFQDYMSIDRGNQLLKFGGRFRLASQINVATPNFNGTFTFPSFDAFQITEQGLQQNLTPSQIRANGGGAEQFSISAGKPAVSNKLFDTGLFLQDDWKAKPNLTFGLGLRYELQNDICTRGNLAPRVGFAWGIHQSQKRPAKSVLRVGWGIFYTRIGQGLLLQTAQMNGINQQQFVVQNPDFFPSVPSSSELNNSLITSAIYRLADNLSVPYLMQTSVSLERSLPKATKIAIAYLNSRGIHQLFSTNVNAPFPGTFDNVAGSGIRPLPGDGNIFQFESAGKFEQNQLTVNFSTDSLGSNVHLNGNYTLNYANSNTTGATSFLSNPFDIDQDYGRAAYDIRHRLNLGSRINLPFGFYGDLFLLFTSGQPFNITIGRDLNGDTIFNDRPAFATNLTRPSVVITQFGAFDTLPIPGETIIPPNLGNGPIQETLNVRLAKAFSLGNKEVSASNGKSGNIYKDAWRPLYAIRFEVIANNVFNHPNLSVPIGNLSSPLFGKSTGLAGSPFSSAAASRQLFMRVVFRF